MSDTANKQEPIKHWLLSDIEKVKAAAKAVFERTASSPDAPPHFGYACLMSIGVIDFPVEADTFEDAKEFAHRGETIWAIYGRATPDSEPTFVTSEGE